jgi:molybdopterin synthase sulfur carrier subunit
MSVPVHLSSHLRSYTKGKSDVEAEGVTLGDLMTDMDRRFPGIRFRVIDEQDHIRPHMNFFVGGTLVRDLAAAVPAGQEVLILGALSGG